jgi:hypothetical protein
MNKNDGGHWTNGLIDTENYIYRCNQVHRKITPNTFRVYSCTNKSWLEGLDFYFHTKRGEGHLIFIN